MKKRPTWTRYGKGVIMMGDYPAAKGKAGEKEEQGSNPPKGKSSQKG